MMPQQRQIAKPGIVPALRQPHLRSMPLHSPLDDADAASFAWVRYRRLMLWMGLATLAVIAVTLTLLYRDLGFVSIHFFVATALGVGFAMMLMAALMGLVFLSNSGGHDEVARRSDENQDSDDSSW